MSYSDEERFLFLLNLYSRDVDHRDYSKSLWEIADKLEYSRADAQQIADQLQKQGLLTFVSLSGNVSLTSLGSFEVMLALSQPDKSTRFFSAVSGFNHQDLPAASLRHGNLNGIVTQLKEFCCDLSLSDDVSDRLSMLVDQLESAVNNGNRSATHVVGELQAIDQLLNAQLSA